MDEEFQCPCCGEDVPAGAEACPHCGACRETGWNEDSTRLDGLDLPDDEFDYDRFVQEELDPPRLKRAGLSWFWWAASVVLLALLLLLVLAGLR